MSLAHEEHLVGKNHSAASPPSARNAPALFPPLPARPASFQIFSFIDFSYKLCTCARQSGIGAKVLEKTLAMELNFVYTKGVSAGVMELVDVTDSKSVGLIPRVGSSPTTGTKIS